MCLSTYLICGNVLADLKLGYKLLAHLVENGGAEMVAGLYT